MSELIKKIVNKNLLEYLTLRHIPFQKCGSVTMFKCPYCNKEPLTANIIPNTQLGYCFTCKKQFNLMDIVKTIDFKDKEATEDDIIHHIKQLFNLDIITEQDKKDLNIYIDFYEQNGFDMVPVAKDKKNPIEKDWVNKNHKDKAEWLNWINEGINLGIKTGKKSNILILDIDTKIIPDILKKLLGTTLVQESSKGWHYFYKYDSEIPKTRIDDFKIDIQNEGGQVVIYPSIVDGIQRKMLKLLPIIELPLELKNFIKSKITVPIKTFSEDIREAIKSEDFKVSPSDFTLKNNNLEGICNNSFIKLGGILRKELNVKQTEFVLNIFNKHLLEKPMEDKIIRAMVGELDKYIEFDNMDLAHKILKYLREIDSSSKTDIDLAITGGFTSGENKQRIDKTLNYLIKEGKIVRQGKYFTAIKNMEWQDTILDVGIPINFKMPYFDDYGWFNFGDLLILGAFTAIGKTTLAMNIIKRLVAQNIRPHYIYNEPGGRWGKTALKLGMKDGDFYRVFCNDADKITLPDKSIVIFDWVKPKEYCKTDELFGNLIEKLEKTQSIMICFVQLRSGEENNFFAKDQIGQYPAWVCKYLYTDGNEGNKTKFHVEKVRDGKIHSKEFDILCQYDYQTKEVNTLDEIESNKNDKQ